MGCYDVCLVHETLHHWHDYTKLYGEQFISVTKTMFERLASRLLERFMEYGEMEPGVWIQPERFVLCNF